MFAIPFVDENTGDQYIMSNFGYPGYVQIMSPGERLWTMEYDTDPDLSNKRVTLVPEDEEDKYVIPRIVCRYNGRYLIEIVPHLDN